MKTRISIVLIITTIISYAQITTTNRNIQREVTNVDATNLSNQTLNNTYNNRTLLTKIANKSKKGQVSGYWSKANEKDKYYDVIKIPAIAFPGYVKVTLTQKDTDLRPQMVINTNLNTAGAIISGSSAETNDELSRTAYFTVHPGMNYDVMVAPFFNAKSYNPPIPYTIKWEYTGQQDIYEPNDTRAQAKYIDFDKIIEAFAIAGHTKYYVASNDQNTYDWYSVVLKESAKIKVNLLDTPSDIGLSVRIFNAYGRTVGITTGYKSVASSYSLPKGTYYLEIQPKGKNSFSRAVQNDLKPVPPHFLKPYKFKVLKL